tara:strand:- start:106 stop:1686 length:1581 start_codon:yes stop_codon:yes gene_type:complete
MGFPEDTDAGNGRFNAALNSALRHLWSDLPDVLLTEEFRFHTEPVVEGGTLSVFIGHASNAFSLTDRLTMVSMAGSATDGIGKGHVGRWLEIYDGTRYHMRRIRSIYIANYVHTGGTVTSANHLVMDKPWINSTDTSLSFRVLTLEYPYPADVQKITHLMYNPDSGGASRTIPMLRGDHNRWRRSVGWRATGTPQAWARGDFYQEPAPRYTPVAEMLAFSGTAENVGPTLGSQVWGYHDTDVSGGYLVHHGAGSADTVQPKYGPAGTFSYKVVHVWGRRQAALLTNEYDKEEWYISSASEATEKVEVKWGMGAIRISTPNVDMSHGYNPKTEKPSYHQYGVEKWIYRARHANQETSKAGAPGTFSASEPYEKNAIADGVYYLWKILPGYTTEVYDRGQEDPPDRRKSLEAWHGHQSIRFDRLTTSESVVVMQVVKKPPQLHHDHDAPRVPEECIDALFALCASYLAGDRDGDLEKKQFYLSEFAEHRRRLIRLLGVETAMMPEFGDGLGLSDHEVWESAGQTVKEA